MKLPLLFWALALAGTAFSWSRDRDRTVKALKSALVGILLSGWIVERLVPASSILA